MGLSDEMQAHLGTGVTTVCRAWAITRRDGVTYGFTDHDLELAFDGVTFRADTGLSAMALQQSTGLSVDNSEAVGALSDASIREVDIEAGRFDGADVRAWLVNWADVRQHQLQFRGTIGELRRSGGAFQAELRGLTEALNRPLGRVYQKPCTAVLGDGGCGFDLETPGYFSERAVEVVSERSIFRFSDMSEFDVGWFERGRILGKSGLADGLAGIVKRDYFEGTERVIELWHPLRAQIETGDTVLLLAGCDKRMATCRLKFNNLVNFQGFPDLPGDDWSLIQPVQSGESAGGSRR